MSPLILANLHLIKLAMLATLIGLFVRGGYRLCWPLAAYLGTTLLYNVLISFWPDTFYRYSFWIFKEAVYGLLQLAIAVSIARQAFGLFPRVGAVARGAYSFIAVAMIVLVFQFPTGAKTSEQWKLEIVSRWNARLLAATIVAFCVASFLVAYHRVPIRSFHRRVLLGFTAWLGIAAVTRDVLGVLGPEAREWCNAVESFAALGLNGWCAYAAWQHRTETLVSPEAAAALAALQRAT